MVKSMERVQAIAESGIQTVPHEYIQPADRRPSIESEESSACCPIPVIDLVEFHPDQAERVIKEIDQACREWGVFQIINHGVPQTLMAKIRNLGLKFFQRPVQEKLKYACTAGSAASEGYGSRMLVKQDQVLDWRDYFDHHTLPLSRRNPHKWPSDPPAYRDTIQEYSEQMKILAQRLLSLMSQALGLCSDYLLKAVGQPYQNITVSYYPPCPQPELTLGLQDHSDMGAVTLLIQDDVGGLQVLNGSTWFTVKPIPNAIVVNLGDQSQILTNGEYKSIVHRAVANAKRARLSVATFYDPSKVTKISPALELITQDSPKRYKEVLYGDYVSAWYSKGPDGKRNIEALEI